MVIMGVMRGLTVMTVNCQLSLRFYGADSII